GGDRGIIRVKKRDFDDLAARKIPAIYPQIYGRTDGMLSEECSSGFSPSGLRTKRVWLWFPALKGVAVLDPHHRLSSPAPAMLLEQVLEDGVPEPSIPTRASDG